MYGQLHSVPDQLVDTAVIIGTQEEANDLLQVGRMHQNSWLYVFAPNGGFGRRHRWPVVHCE